VRVDKDPCHDKNVFSTVQCFCHTCIYQTALLLVFHKCRLANDDPMTPEKLVEEAEAEAAVIVRSMINSTLNVNTFTHLKRIKD